MILVPIDDFIPFSQPQTVDHDVVPLACIPDQCYLIRIGINIICDPFTDFFFDPSVFGAVVEGRIAVHIFCQFE